MKGIGRDDRRFSPRLKLGQQVLNAQLAGALTTIRSKNLAVGSYGTSVAATSTDTVAKTFAISTKIAVLDAVTLPEDILIRNVSNHLQLDDDGKRRCSGSGGGGTTNGLVRTVSTCLTLQSSR